VVAAPSLFPSSSLQRPQGYLPAVPCSNSDSTHQYDSIDTDFARNGQLLACIRRGCRTRQDSPSSATPSSLRRLPPSYTCLHSSSKETFLPIHLAQDQIPRISVSPQTPVLPGIVDFLQTFRPVLGANNSLVASSGGHGSSSAIYCPTIHSVNSNESNNTYFKLVNDILLALRVLGIVTSLQRVRVRSAGGDPTSLA
jgi:hypothetical protein